MDHDKFTNPAEKRQIQTTTGNNGASVTEMGTAERAEDLGQQNARISINDLPPEILLFIFSWLSLTDLCISVAPVCSRWRLLAKHPCLWTELSFDGNRVSTEQVCTLLRSSPSLKKLTLTKRDDSNTVLEEVCASNRSIHTIEMKGCQGTENEQKIDERIFIKVLECCSKLRILTLDDTHVSSLDFYRLLAESLERFMHVSLIRAKKRDAECFAEECFRLRTPKDEKQLSSKTKKRLEEMETFMEIFQNMSTGGDEDLIEIYADRV
jgi:hypothetical protein